MLGHAFFGHNSAICWLIGLKFSMGSQETIIYRLVVRNSSYDAYFSFLIVCVTFGEKMGVATTRAPNGLGSPNWPKRWPTGWTLKAVGQPIIRNRVFEIFKHLLPLIYKCKFSTKFQLSEW